MITSKQQKRSQRKRRIRAKVSGTKERPRLAVFRSNKYLYAQLVDDVQGTTLASASTRENKDLKKTATSLVEIAKKTGVAKAVFDRGGFLYEGNVRAFADAVREAGLEI